MFIRVFRSVLMEILHSALETWKLCNLHWRLGDFCTLHWRPGDYALCTGDLETWRFCTLHW